MHGWLFAFIRLAITGIMLYVPTLLGVHMYRMLKRMTNFGGSDMGEFLMKAGNNMIPSPTPASESSKY